MIGTTRWRRRTRPGSKLGRRNVSPRLERMEERTCLSGLTAALGVASPVNGQLNFAIDSYITGRADVTKTFGAASDIPVAGDFTGSGLTTVGVFRPSTGTWILDTKNNGTAGVTLQFGGPKWKPVVGDVNGDGRTDLGLYDPTTGVWGFTTDLSGRVSVAFKYGGTAGDVPLLFDFNHDGVDDPVIYNNGQWLVDTNSDRVPDQIYRFGGAGLATGATPIVFDLYGTHDPALAVVFPQANGTLMWYINPSRDGKTYGKYQFGSNGSTPITGNFTTASTLFVNPAIGWDGAGAGTFASPYKTINAAVAAAAPGTTIRLAVGYYPENVNIVNKSNLKIVGAGLYSSIINPPSKDAFFVYQSSNIVFDKMWLLSPGTDGRGILALAASVETYLIRTDGTRWLGIEVVGQNGWVSTLTARYSRFDGIQTIAGVYLEDAANANLYGISASGIGFATDYTGYSSGLVVNKSSTAYVDQSTFYHNRDDGVMATGTSRLEMVNSYTGDHPEGFGAIILQGATAIFRNVTFANIGTNFGPTGGTNGIEFADDFTGYGYVENSRFYNCTANGIFVHSAPNQIQILNNVFSGNWAGVTLHADAAQPIYVRVAGNSFLTPANATYQTFGVTATGSRSHLVVGGPGANQNYFDGFANHQFIAMNDGTSSNQPWLGWPDVTVLENIYKRNGMTISPADAITQR